MKKQMTGLLIAVVAVAVVFAAGFLASSYVVAYNFSRAVKAKDAKAVSGSMDLVSIRKDLKTRFEARMAKESARNNLDNTAPGMGSDFAMAFIDPAFNLLVSPEGMAVMLNGEKPEIDMTTVKIKPSSGPAQTSMSYSRLNKFIVRVKNPGKKSSTTLVFKRHGLFCWKLSSVKWEM